MVCVAAFSMSSLMSCNSDEDEQQDECTPEFSTSAATGVFMGDNFTFVEGTAEEDFANSAHFRIVLYGEPVSGDACDGFNFDKPDSTIIFSVPMEVGLYDLGVDYSVTFNDASVTNEVNADVSLCGAVEIVSVNDTQVTGRLDVEANADSELNGTFTLERCD